MSRESSQEAIEKKPSSEGKFAKLRREQRETAAEKRELNKKKSSLLTNIDKKTQELKRFQSQVKDFDSEEQEQRKKYPHDKDRTPFPKAKTIEAFTTESESAAEATDETKSQASKLKKEVAKLENQLKTLKMQLEQQDPYFLYRISHQQAHILYGTMAEYRQTLERVKSRPISKELDALFDVDDTMAIDQVFLTWSTCIRTLVEHTSRSNTFKTEIKYLTEVITITNESIIKVEDWLAAKYAKTHPVYTRLSKTLESNRKRALVIRESAPNLAKAFKEELDDIKLQDPPSEISIIDRFASVLTQIAEITDYNAKLDRIEKLTQEYTTARNLAIATKEAAHVTAKRFIKEPVIGLVVAPLEPFEFDKRMSVRYETLETYQANLTILIALSEEHKTLHESLSKLQSEHRAFLNKIKALQNYIISPNSSELSTTRHRTLTQPTQTLMDTIDTIQTKESKRSEKERSIDSTDMGPVEPFKNLVFNTRLKLTATEEDIEIGTAELTKLQTTKMELEKDLGSKKSEVVEERKTLAKGTARLLTRCLLNKPDSSSSEPPAQPVFSHEPSVNEKLGELLDYERSQFEPEAVSEPEPEPEPRIDEELRALLIAEFSTGHLKDHLKWSEPVVGDIDKDHYSTHDEALQRSFSQCKAYGEQLEYVNTAISDYTKLKSSLDCLKATAKTCSEKLDAVLKALRISGLSKYNPSAVPKMYVKTSTCLDTELGNMRCKVREYNDYIEATKKATTTCQKLQGQQAPQNELLKDIRDLEAQLPLLADGIRETEEKMKFRGETTTVSEGPGTNLFYSVLPQEVDRVLVSIEDEHQALLNYKARLNQQLDQLQKNSKQLRLRVSQSVIATYNTREARRTITHDNPTIHFFFKLNSPRFRKKSRPAMVEFIEKVEDMKKVKGPEADSQPTAEVPLTETERLYCLLVALLVVKRAIESERPKVTSVLYCIVCREIGKINRTLNKASNLELAAQDSENPEPASDRRCYADQYDTDKLKKARKYLLEGQLFDKLKPDNKKRWNLEEQLNKQLDEELNLGSTPMVC